MDRRSFLLGTATIGAAVASAGLVGCAPKNAEEGASSEGAVDEGRKAPENIVETVDADICVIGAGVAGLSCAVQAALDGSKVVLLEKNSITGGNGNVIEGMFAFGTSLSEANGVSVSARDVIDHEMAAAQYCCDGALWRRFVDSAKGNWEWLVEQGCEYSGLVDTYGPGVQPTFHWLKDGVGSAGLVPQMTARVEELGIDLRVSTPATMLIKDESGAIVGCYAENAKGEAIQVNAKATVIATGGWGTNEEIIAKQGFDVTDVHFGGTPCHDGDGYTMAMEIGAMDTLPHASQLSLNIIPALPKSTFKHPYNGITGISSGFSPVIWVNQDGVRFANESILMGNMMLQAIPAREQKATYTIFDSAIWKAATAGLTDCDPDAELETAVAENSPESLWMADTIEGLAEAAGLDAQALKATIEEYNADCATGEGDSVFNRGAQFMAAIENPPYYIARTRLHFVTSFGGIGTDINFRVVDDEKQPIPGLYAAGVDGDMRYRDVYPIEMPGTASMGCVWSGRTAAASAKEYIATL